MNKIFYIKIIGGERMFLFEYLIKLLMGNSNTLFLGLIMVIFGYYGWLLFNINNQLHTSTYEWDIINNKLRDIMNKLDKINELYSKELTDKLNDNKNLLKEMNSYIKNNNEKLEKLEGKIISEVKEESGEIKERMNILVGRRSNISEDEDDDLIDKG